MAKMVVKGVEEYALALSALGDRSQEVAGKAIFNAAGIVADAIRANLNAIPVDTFRYLRDGDELRVVTADDKRELLEAFGVSRVAMDKDGYWNVRIGFDRKDYTDHKTKKYPQGVPILMLARSIESGSSVRQKHPFVEPAVRATKKRALAAMEQTIDEETQKIMDGG